MPWQGGNESRKQALAYVGAHLTAHHGGFALAEIPADRPWCKGDAVGVWLNDAVMTGDLPDVITICDADCIVDPVSLDAAVEAVGSGRYGWAVPHTQVRRLTREATADVYAGAPLNAQNRFERMPYRGVEAGGVVVVATGLYLRAPFDPRFQSWGAEDVSAGLAWRCLSGEPWRALTPLFHLYHEPQPRMSAGVGSRESQLLCGRYQAASASPLLMTELIAEGQSALPSPA